MRILGPPSADRATVEANLRTFPGLHARFLAEMVPALWDAAVSHGIDPVGVVAQAHKETGGGNYRGKVKPDFYNTCGLKIRHVGILPGTTGDEPLAHQMFPSWQIGALAHVQHLAAYAGAPVPSPIVDPRYVWVAGQHRLENFEELGGKWAPSTTYGTELVATARRLQAAVPVASPAYTGVAR